MLPPPVQTCSDDSDVVPPLPKKRHYGDRDASSKAVPRRVTCLSDDSGVSEPEPGGDAPAVTRPLLGGGALAVTRCMPGGDAPTVTEPLPGTTSGFAMLEIFSGEGNLSRAFAALGALTWTFDFKNNPADDILDCLAQERICFEARRLKQIMGGKVYMHFAPPCSTFSQARLPWIRSRAQPHGLPLKVIQAKQVRNPYRERHILRMSNQVTSIAYCLMTTLSAEGITITMEQPAGSVMRFTSWHKQWAAAVGAEETVVDYCQFGCSFRKRTVLFGPPGLLDDVGQLCRCQGRHAQTLSGWGANRSANVPTAAGCASYPPLLCERWARVVLGKLTGS